MNTITLSILSLSIVASVGCNSSIEDKGEKPANQAKNEVETKKEEKMKETGAFLEITLKIEDANRPAAVGVYSKYKQPFLTTIDGATSKDLLVRTDDVQVIHGFETEAQATAYLTSELFSKDIVGELGPLLAETPEVRVYSSAALADKYPSSTGAFLEITLKVSDANRSSAGGVYEKYKAPFLNQIDGAVSKELLMRGDDVQVLHGFATEAQANAYLTSELFSKDIVGELGPLLDATPEVKVYSVFK
jgi:hypothetical protein